MTNNRKNPPRGVAIPSGRLSRMARFGGLTAGIAGGMAAEGLRRVAAGERPSLESMLLTPANAARFANQLAQLRGAAMKVGQLLSMEGGELLPPEWAETLGRLRADADYMPSRQLKTVLIQNWGPDFLKRFERFDVQPIAAASIGQVHRARTRDGRDLAIKVQYPGVRGSIDSDVANVATLIRMSGQVPKALDLAPLLDEAKRQLHDEADYAREGRCLAQFGALMADSPDYQVPGFHPDLSTTDLLAMDFLEGVPIESLASAPQGERDRVMGLLIDLLLRELFEFRLMQTDPNFANYRYSSESKSLILLDFGATRAFSEERSALYRRFMGVCLSGDREALRGGAIEMGYFPSETEPRLQDMILRAIEIGLEPLRHDGPYDFASACMVERLHRLGTEFAHERDFAHTPPIETLFMQRKVAGLFLLGTRLKARVNIRSRMAPYLAAHAASQ
ncbi:MAG: AarF/ABC1/UbiB kinase family protein [Rhodobacteraceae bacterium]|nr:AarF/ABC1/UbiB kinase family protein [Paracoccaceae bacterium]